jgi:ferritin
MMKETIQDAINRQINRELYSAYLYTAMSAYFETLTLRGAAKYMRIQANEERTHAMKFFDYIIERGGTVKLTAIDSIVYLASLKGMNKHSKTADDHIVPKRCIYDPREATGD